MSEDQKDVAVHVTGVSMRGEVKDDSKRPASTDQEKSGQAKAGDS
tara:strand:- start:331 stop:465 length:135 start_codon:yes stop_codon:yes gene_type:complete